MNFKFLITSCIVVLLGLGNTYALPEAWVDHAVFINPQGDPYAEIYMHIPCKSLTPYKEGKDSLIGAEVLITFSRGKKITNFDGFNLIVPFKNKESITGQLIKSLRRIAIAKGEYKLTIEIKDKANPKSILVLSYPEFKVRGKSLKLNFSDIMFLESIGTSKGGNFERNGYDMPPYPYRFYNTGNDTIILYTELYNFGEAPKDEEFLYFSSILNEDESDLNNDFFQFKKITLDRITSHLNIFDISKVPSGNYTAVVELRSKENKLLARRSAFFQRINKDIDPIIIKEEKLSDSAYFTEIPERYLVDYMQRLLPLSNKVQERVIEGYIEDNNFLEMRKYLRDFWYAHAPQSPKKSWLKHKKLTQMMDEKFTTVSIPGYLSDRGRIYIEFGQPTEIHTRSFEASIGPYEVWQYNRIHTGETNISFIFVNSAIASNEYRLRHSDAMNELKDTRLRDIIYNDLGIMQNRNLDRLKEKDGF